MLPGWDYNVLWRKTAKEKDLDSPVVCRYNKESKGIKKQNAASQMETKSDLP